MQREDFHEILFTSDEWLNVWGRWKCISGEREETIDIDSALVSPDTASALLRALQTAPHNIRFRIPPAGDELEIDRPRFKLKGWIDDRHYDPDLDQYDPWAGDVRFPPIEPSAFITECMHLTSTDQEMRYWCIRGRKHPVLTSQLWGDRDTKWRRSENGRRLQSCRQFLLQMLQKLDMDLIIDVSIDRRIHHASYSYSERDRELEHVSPYFKLFLLRRSGAIETI